MAKRIITISREFGSGGRFIGEKVAKKLGIKYYDKDIIGQIAEQSGLSPEYIQENAEKEDCVIIGRMTNYNFYTEQKWGMCKIESIKYAVPQIMKNRDLWHMT